MDTTSCKKTQFWRDDIQPALRRSALPMPLSDLIKVVPEPDRSKDFWAAIAWAIRLAGDYTCYRRSETGEMMVDLDSDLYTPEYARDDLFLAKIEVHDCYLPLIPERFVRGLLLNNHTVEEPITQERAVQLLKQEFPELNIITDEQIIVEILNPVCLALLPTLEYGL